MNTTNQPAVQNIEVGNLIAFVGYDAPDAIFSGVRGRVIDTIKAPDGSTARCRVQWIFTTVLDTDTDITGMEFHYRKASTLVVVKA